MRFTIEDYDDSAMDAIVYLEETADTATYTNKTLSTGQALLFLLAHYIRTLESPPSSLAPDSDDEPGGSSNE